MKYEVPNFEMIKLNNVDIITTSVGDAGVDEETKGNGNASETDPVGVGRN